MRVLTLNRVSAATLLGTDGFPLLAAVGYTAATLKEPTLDRTWKASAAAVTHSIVLDLGAAWAVNCCALFDLYAATIVAPSVALYSGPANSGPWTKRADLVLGGRRDWGANFTSTTARYWRLDIVPNFGGTSQPEVAHIALGLATDLPGAAARQTTLEDAVEVNGSQATKFGEEVVSFSLAWQNLDATEHGSLVSFKRAVGGAYRPFVMWPRVTVLGEVYLVRLGNALGWAMNFDLYDGHGLEATELERTLRG
jgi:hypothetical protein